MVFPNDLQELEYEEPPRAHGTLHSGIGYRPPKVVPYDQELRKAAEVLNAGKKVAILVGAGALKATDEVIAGGRPPRCRRCQSVARQGCST